MSRGGKRAGAGRKQVVPFQIAIEVGEHCEVLWRKAAEDQAYERYRTTSEGRMISDEQSSADLIPLVARRRSSLRNIAEAIDEITDGRRRIRLPIQRPYNAKDKILEKAAAYCKSVFETAITKTQANECWKEYRRFKKWRENQAFLKSP